jgi:hypothetical protein
MFGFGKRKKYNAAIDIKLNNEYQITTSNNDQFPGVLKYLEIIDNAWNSKMTEDEGALYIATLYYCGLANHGINAEAAQLYRRISQISEFGLTKGLIGRDRWERFSEAIEKARTSTPF